MKKNVIIILTVSLLFSVPVSAQSISKCIDKSGRVEYTSGPCVGDNKKSEKLDIKVTKSFFSGVVSACSHKKTLLSFSQCIDMGLSEYIVNYDSEISKPFADDYIEKLREIVGRVQSGKISDSVGARVFNDYALNLDMQRQAAYNAYQRSVSEAIKRSRVNSESGYSVSGSNGCSSDFDCGVGVRCVKAPLESEGVCMKIVDEYGVQQYDLPDLDSVGPNMSIRGECDFDTDCGIGFRCHRKYQACVKD